MNNPKVMRLEAQITSSAEEIASYLYDAFMQMPKMLSKLQMARRIFIKANLVGYMDSARNRRDLWYKGHPIGSTTPVLAEAVLKLVRRLNGSSEIYLGDGLDISGSDTANMVFERAGLLMLVERYKVQLIDCNEGPYQQLFVPGGGQIYRYLHFREEVAGADFIINLPKLKVHTTTGVSIGIKNMFGILPRCFYGGYDRSLMHSNLFKLSRILVDVISVRKPDVTIVDAIISSNKYFIGEPVEMNQLVVSDNVVSADAACTALMGFDPQALFPSTPFTDMENHIMLAYESGLGQACLEKVCLSDNFFDNRYTFSLEHLYYVMTPEEIISWQRIVAEGARYYLNNHQKLLSLYARQWVYIRKDHVLWSVDAIKDCSHKVRMEHREDNYGFCIQVLPSEEQPECITHYLSITNGSNKAYGLKDDMAGGVEIEHSSITC